MFPICEADYSIWCERFKIASLLKEVGMFTKAKEVINSSPCIELISPFIAIIRDEANKQLRYDLIKELNETKLISAIA